MIVNGKTYNYEAMTVSALLSAFDVEPSQVVVEVDGEIITKMNFETHLLDKEAKVELVAFVGGG